MKLDSKTALKAFTLWELIVAMLITSLIVSLSYGLYWKFTRILQQEADLSGQMHTLRLLERDIYRLTQSCNSMTGEESQLFFNFREGTGIFEFTDSTLAIFFEGAIDNSGDTPFFSFRSESESSAEYQSGTVLEIPIDGWSVRYLNNRTEHIDQFRVIFRVDLQTLTMTFTKNYPRFFLYSLPS